MNFNRIFWLTNIGLAIYFGVWVGLQTWEQYLNKSVVLSIRRDHYSWNTSMPSLTICPNYERISRNLFDIYAKNNKIKDDEKEDFYEFLNSMANASYATFKNIENFSSTDSVLNRLLITPNVYIRIISKLTEDKSQEDKFDTKIKNINDLEPIAVVRTLTDFGICYTTNNFLSNNLSTSFLLSNIYPDMEKYHYDVDKIMYVKHGNIFDGHLTYNFNGFNRLITIYLHSPYEVMNVAKPMGTTPDTMEFEVFSTELLSEPYLQENTWVIQRKCRFHNESNLEHFPVYTKNLCLSECRAKLMLEKCGCIPHFIPNRVQNPKRVCNWRELKECATLYEDMFIEFRRRLPNGTIEFIDCECMTNCEDTEIVVERIQKLSGASDIVGSLGGLVITKKYPQVRYYRQQLFTFTDLLISIGGAAGLFIGFSVKGLLQIIHHFTWRLLTFRSEP
uniref:CSON009699 protein n=1 Tax=Culicoides sonorensis TaxID=179676 RepID=A0A336KHS0_CULSO